MRLRRLYAHQSSGSVCRASASYGASAIAGWSPGCSQRFALHRKALALTHLELARTCHTLCELSRLILSHRRAPGIRRDRGTRCVGMRVVKERFVAEQTLRCVACTSIHVTGAVSFPTFLLRSPKFSGFRAALVGARRRSSRPGRFRAGTGQFSHVFAKNSKIL